MSVNVELPRIVAEQRALLRKNLRQPRSRADIIRDYCRGKRVLDIGCVNHDLGNVDGAGWLHKAIVDCAASVLGIDYLEPEVLALRSRGYNVVCADVTIPLDLDDKFDVAVVGNLIEHLSNFDGLFQNLLRVLKPSGIALISTNNPFYREQYFYSALKNDILVNREHTCWICPITMAQLASRCGFAPVDVHWVREGWPMSACILHSPKHSLDIYTGKWVFAGPPKGAEAMMAGAISVLARGVPHPRLRRGRARYGDDFGRCCLLFARAWALGACWRAVRWLIPTSAINRHELYVSAFRRADLNIEAGPGHYPADAC